MNLIYLSYELRRTLRNRRFFFFTLLFPVFLYFTIAGSNRHVTIEGLSFPLYFMAGMATWGSMSAVITSASRIAEERKTGWTRQLRITPLNPRTYIGAKVLSGYLVAVVTLVVLGLCGASLGVHLTPARWLWFFALILVGLAPLAAIGIALGHVVKFDSLGPVIGGVTSLFALLGGSFGPLAQSGLLLDVVKLLPSYWLVQAGHLAIPGTGAWPLEGWLVILVWTLVTVRLAMLAYRRDTARG